MTTEEGVRSVRNSERNTLIMKRTQLDDETATSVAKWLGMSPGCATDVVQREKARILKLYERGRSITEIAAEYAFPEGNIAAIIYEMRRRRQDRDELWRTQADEKEQERHDSTLEFGLGYALDILAALEAKADLFSVMRAADVSADVFETHVEMLRPFARS